MQMGGKAIDYYEISMRQFQQQILPPGLPPLLSGDMARSRQSSKKGLLVHNAPSLTIEAKWNNPVRVKWINELVDAHGNYLPHLLPVDPTLHWANPPGGTDGARHAADVHRNAGPVHRPGAHRDACAWRRGCRRRERRLRRGVVSPRGEEHPGRLRDRGHLVQLLQGEGGDELRRRMGPGIRRPSSIRTRTAPRPSGITTTRWA